MSDVPKFFLPVSSPDTVETDFASVAKMAHCAVPELSQRVYSITFTNDGEEWVATVGQQLRGVQRRKVRSGGASVECDRPVSDPATVLAIFPGSPYIVVTNHRIAADLGSKWENPFMAGQPKSVTRFCA